MKIMLHFQQAIAKRDLEHLKEPRANKFTYLNPKICKLLKLIYLSKSCTIHESQIIEYRSIFNGLNALDIINIKYSNDYEYADVKLTSLGNKIMDHVYNNRFNKAIRLSYLITMISILIALILMAISECIPKHIAISCRYISCISIFIALISAITNICKSSDSNVLRTDEMLKIIKQEKGIDIAKKDKKVIDNSKSLFISRPNSN